MLSNTPQQQQLQASLFFICNAAPALLKLVVSQYRCKSTNRMRASLDWAVLFSTLIAILSAGNERNAFLIGATLANLLAFINGIGLGLYVLVGLVAFLRHNREFSPLNFG